MTKFERKLSVFCIPEKMMGVALDKILIVDLEATCWEGRVVYDAVKKYLMEKEQKKNYQNY